MNKEDYVSFEIAKLLKEKGFKHWCYKCYGDAVYHKGIPISFDEECDLKSEGLENEIEYVEGGYLYDFGCDNRKEEAKVWAAPTLWEAMKWLRETHNIGIFPSLFAFCVGKGGAAKPTYGTKIISLKSCELLTEDTNPMPTYEEACEEAIRYCLENLI